MSPVKRFAEDQRISQLENSLAERTRELEVLQIVQQAINRQLDLRTVLQLIADYARQLTNCRASTVYLIEEDYLVLAVVSGELETEVQVGFRMPLAHTVAGMAIHDRKPYRILQAKQDPRVYAGAINRSNVDSFLVVPLISGDRPLGVISVANKISGELSLEDERILTLLASSTVISLENARLYERAADAAVLAERNRLARELHDAVTQSLFSASLIGDVLPQIWELDPVEGRKRLEELRLLTRGALAEMRTMLLELRPSALVETPLPDLLRHLTNAFTGRTRIPVQFCCSGEAPVTGDVKTCFYRIAQEALNNVGKHADPENVFVHFESSSERARLEIIDDGCGFEPYALPDGHLGIGIMKERADSVGARLSIRSAPGEGTNITLSWQPAEEKDER